MRLIDADELRRRMYHEAFETDSDMQKWDSGCWIRYKLFENVIDSVETIDAVPVVRCRYCQHWEQATSESGNCNRAFEITAYATDFCSYGEKRNDRSF